MEKQQLTCPQCGSDNQIPLGTLGLLLWFRCRQCGWEHSIDHYDVDDFDTPDNGE